MDAGVYARPETNVAVYSYASLFSVITDLVYFMVLRSSLVCWVVRKRIDDHGNKVIKRVLYRTALLYKQGKGGDEPVS